MTAAERVDQAALATVAEIAAERAGLHFAESRKGAVETGIRRAMSRCGESSPARFAALVKAGGAALDHLVSELTVGETYFFREPAQFDFIRREVAPALLRRGGEVRAWSAGCATGEEAYSLAILLREEGLWAGRPVLGTDVSRERLARARRGRYTAWSMRGLPAAIAARWLRREGSTFAVAAEIRDAVEFHVLNLAGDGYPSTRSRVWEMDLVLCRNVLIYLDRATVEHVAARLLASLADDGWLFLGASDPPLSGLVPCEVVVTPAGIAYRRASAPRRAGAEAPVSIPPLASVPATVVQVDAEGSPDRPRVGAGFAVGEGGAPATPSMAGTGDGGLIDRPFPAVPTGAGGAADGPTDGGEEAGIRVRAVRALADQGRLEEAGRACAEAMERHRASAELAHLHAVLLLAAGRPAEAADAARRALYLDRGFAAAHLALGLARERLGERDAALRAFRAAERVLAGLPSDAAVPGADGETAGGLREMLRVRIRLLREGAA